MFGIIYKATCVANGKVYVGQTIVSLQSRQRDHFYEAARGEDSYFCRALRKYGKDYFVWEQIDGAETIEELNQKEIYWIAFYRCFEDPAKGYNSDSGGKNAKSSEETKKKIGDALRGKKKNITPEGFLKKQEVCRNRVWSQESKDKLSIARIGQKSSSETIEKIKKANTGKTRSPEAKQHYVERWTEEERQKRREKYTGENNPNYGKHLSKESRLSISEKAKARGGRTQTDEERKKRSDSIRAWHAKRKQLLLEQSTN